MINESIKIGNKIFPNRVVLQPMEGCDCQEDGSPSELTIEKYNKAARSGAGVIWMEATAVCPEGRTNARQMMLTEKNLPEFRAMVDGMRKIAKEHNKTQFVFAHPGEAARVEEHISVMLECENVYLDISGTGLFRYGMLKHLVTKVGADRILFGSDYPICNPGMYIAGVEFEKLMDNEKELIFAGNAKRLLKI